MRGTLKVNWLNHSCSWMQNQTPILCTIVILGKGTYWRFLVSIVYEVWVGRQEDLPAQLYLGFCTEISLGERPPLMGEECAGPKGSGAGLFCQPGQLIVSASLQEREQSTECRRFHQEWNFFHLNSELFYIISLWKSPGYVKYRVLQNMFTITAGTNRPEVYNLASGHLAVFLKRYIISLYVSTWPHIFYSMWDVTLARQHTWFNRAELWISAHFTFKDWHHLF